MSRQRKAAAPALAIPEDCFSPLSFRIRSVGANEDLEVLPNLFNADDNENNFSFFTRTIPTSLLPLNEEISPLENQFKQQLDFNNHLIESSENFANIENSSWPRTIDYGDLFTLKTSPYIGEDTFRGDRDKSTSLLRAPGSIHDFVRGSSKNVPFLPGGTESSSYDENKEISISNAVLNSINEILDADFDLSKGFFLFIYSNFENSK